MPSTIQPDKNEVRTLTIGADSRMTSIPSTTPDDDNSAVSITETHAPAVTAQNHLTGIQSAFMSDETTRNSYIILANGIFVAAQVQMLATGSTATRTLLLSIGIIFDLLAIFATVCFLHYGLPVRDGEAGRSTVSTPTRVLLRAASGVPVPLTLLSIVGMVAAFIVEIAHISAWLVAVMVAVLAVGVFSCIVAALVMTQRGVVRGVTV